MAFVFEMSSSKNQQVTICLKRPLVFSLQFLPAGSLLRVSLDTALVDR